MDGQGSNGHAERPPDLAFGDAPGNVLTHDHAEAVLRLLWTNQRALLSAVIGEAFTGVKPQAIRQKKS